MKGKRLQLIGIIAYTVLAIISVLSFSFETSSKLNLSYFSDLIMYVLVFQSGVIILVINYFKENRISLFGIIFSTFIRIICAVPIFFISTFTNDTSVQILYVSYTLLYIEIIAKVILGIYNIIVSLYGISKGRIIKKLISGMKLNKDVSVIANYMQLENANTITLVYKTIDGVSIKNLEQILKLNDSHYIVNIINSNDIRNEDKYDEIILNLKNLYNDGRVESPHY